MHIFDTELKYQYLLKIISSPYSSGLKLLCLSDFLSPLIKKQSQDKYYSYYIDLKPYLCYQIRKKEFNHFTPEDICNLENIIITFEQLEIFKSNQNEFYEVKEILKYESEKIYSYLEGNTKTKNQNLDDSLSQESLAIVFIEKCDSSGYIKNIKNGVIQKLHLNSTIRSKPEKLDKVEFKNLIEFDKTEIIEQLNFVVEKAKNLCERNKISTHSYNYSFYFDSQDYIYLGCSLGIGAICLAYNSILINELQTNYFKFRKDCVFSGEISEEGKLVKLDDECLKIKLKTVFFSGYKKFIIPEDNIAEAKIELAHLTDKYPKRKLELIPVNSCEGIFNNLSIVERLNLKVRQKLKAKYKKNQVVVNLIFVLLFIAISGHFIANFLVPYFDKNPISYDYINDRYLAFNKYGKKVFESEILEKINYDLIKNNYYADKRIIIDDINDDGIKEIIYLNSSNLDNLKKRSIYCYQPSNHLIWSYSIPEKILFYKNQGENYIDNSFIIAISAINDPKTRAKKILYYGNYNDYFPYYIGLLDCNGKFISEFINSGHTGKISIFDIDNDGKDEIIAAGQNNLKMFNSACFIIFDPEFLSGVSPETNPLGDNRIGLEKYYIILPRTVVLENANLLTGNESSKMPRNEASFILNRQKSNILVSTRETNDTPSPSILYYFDDKMNLTNIDADDYFEIAYNHLLEKKIIPDITLDEYLNTLKEKILWWDGVQFENKPAMNKYYLEAKMKDK